MIKFVLAALWISAATAGAIFLSFSMQQPKPEVAVEPGAFGGLDYVSSGIISVPLLEAGRVKGYFLSRLVYTAESAKLAQVKLPMEAVLSDTVYSHLYANPQIDFSDRDTIDLDAFRNGIKTAINARIGEEIIRDVLVEQFDYLAKNEVQATTIRAPASAQRTMPTPGAAAAH